METKNESAAASAEKPRRVIKRYSNRKLYDTKDSRYVTLLQIAEMVRTGEEVQIIDNNTKDDLTEVTLAQIIYEEQKAQTRPVPLQTLKEIIHQRTVSVLQDLREGPIGRLIPGTKSDVPPAPGSSSQVGETKTAADVAGKVDATAQAGANKVSELVDQAKVTIEDFQHKIDERVRTILPSLNPWQQLQNEVKRLTSRIEDLEKQLAATGPAGAKVAEVAHKVTEKIAEKIEAKDDKTSS